MAFLLRLLPLASLALAASRSHPFFPPTPAVPLIPTIDLPVTSRNGTALPPYNQIYNFTQLIDHNNPSKGTFTQRFFFTYEWFEPGGPITLFTPGEAAFDPYSGYLTNRTIVGQIAQATNGASVVLEHRFFGLSNPGPDLSATSLATHTLDQAIADLVYFVNNVQLPMPGGDNVKPDKTAWLLIGGSYSGALTGWTMVKAPGVFWAGYASSAVVETINYFWGYFEPIRQHMPQNCSADVQAVIAHVDHVFTQGTPAQIQAVKSNFGMGDVTHLDDVAGALRNNMWDWQSLSPNTGPGAQFFKFCDALEVDNGVSAPATGFGLDHALNAWGSYWNSTYLARICGNSTAEDCFTSYDLTQSFWLDVSLGQDWRSWFWIVCNQVGFLQDGAPVGWPSLVTRLVTPPYDERQCLQTWPDHFKTPPVPSTASTNKELHGWDLNVNRLFIANGNNDPWREATTSSDFHPRLSTDRQPIFTSNGFHCSDLITSNAVDPTVKAVQDLGVAFMGKWVNEWRSLHHGVSNASAITTPDPATLPKPPAFVPISIPQAIVNGSPPKVPASISGVSAPPPHGHRPPAKHDIPNAWAKKVGITRS